MKNDSPFSVPPKVLVVDDEPGFRDLLLWALNRRGIHAQGAQNGLEGAALAAKTSFDVVITDVTMPEMDGLKLLEEIKKTSPKTEVIVITGFGVVETAVYAMKKGAFDFVLKPCHVESLMSLVRQAVERRHPK